VICSRERPIDLVERRLRLGDLGGELPVPGLVATSDRDLGARRLELGGCGLDGRRVATISFAWIRARLATAARRFSMRPHAA
jgi:hypothetical protein